MRRMILAAMTLVMASAANARSKSDGAWVYASCSEPATRPAIADYGLCLGYVSAIVDALAAGDTISGWKACMPLKFSSQLGVETVLNFIRNHPESRSYSASSVIAAALGAAFPCR